MRPTLRARAAIAELSLHVKPVVPYHRLSVALTEDKESEAVKVKKGIISREVLPVINSQRFLDTLPIPHTIPQKPVEKNFRHMIEKPVGARKEAADAGWYPKVGKKRHLGKAPERWKEWTNPDFRVAQVNIVVGEKLRVVRSGDKKADARVSKSSRDWDEWMYEADDLSIPGLERVPRILTVRNVNKLLGSVEVEEISTEFKRPVQPPKSDYNPYNPEDGKVEKQDRQEQERKYQSFPLGNVELFLGYFPRQQVQYPLETLIENPQDAKFRAEKNGLVPVFATSLEATEAVEYKALDGWYWERFTNSTYPQLVGLETPRIQIPWKWETEDEASFDIEMPIETVWEQPADSTSDHPNITSWEVAEDQTWQPEEPLLVDLTSNEIPDSYIRQIKGGDEETNHLPMELFTSQELSRPDSRWKRQKKWDQERALNHEELQQWIKIAEEDYEARKVRVLRGEEQDIMSEPITGETLVKMVKLEFSAELARRRAQRVAESLEEYHSRWGPTKTERRRLVRGRNVERRVSELPELKLNSWKKNQFVPEGLAMLPKDQQELLASPYQPVPPDRIQ